ncbi:hypothetical protein LCGC14_0546120 [marine sediment metagenome]|uniref:Uncharacterized protein n=1 Tax=marine sediment metagenome TaxID=412755 RepID=A0A0F9S9U0_9ZZZZ
MNKKLFIYAIVGIFAISFVFAAWAFSYNNTIQASVFPTGGVLLIVEDISNFSVNATNGNVTNIQNISLFNRNGQKPTILNLTVNKVLTEVSCPNFINDCNIELKNATSVINDGDSISLISGFNNFTLETSCIQFSCGQNISIEVDIT